MPGPNSDAPSPAMGSTNEGDGGAKWHRAAHVSDIEEHWPCPVDIGGTCIALYRMEKRDFRDQRLVYAREGAVERRLLRRDERHYRMPAAPGAIPRSDR